MLACECKWKQGCLIVLYLNYVLIQSFHSIYLQINYYYISLICVNKKAPEYLILECEWREKKDVLCNCERMKNRENPMGNQCSNTNSIKSIIAQIITKKKTSPPIHKTIEY